MAKAFAPSSAKCQHFHKKTIYQISILYEAITVVYIYDKLHTPQRKRTPVTPPPSAGFATGLIYTAHLKSDDDQNCAQSHNSPVHSVTSSHNINVNTAG